MSLPAYLFLYDENGMLVQGECMMPVEKVLSKS